MHIRKGIVLLLILLGTTDIISSQVKPDRASAMSLFSKGDYEPAYRQFRELLVNYPKDPQYKYYAALSLINMKRDPLTAQELLIQAINGTTLKSLPDDALFYLGRARQMAGNFAEAEKAYHRYTEEAGRKKSKELGVQEYLQECRNESGKLSAEAMAPVPLTEEKEVPAAAPDTVKDNPAAAAGKKVSEPFRQSSNMSSEPAGQTGSMDKKQVSKEGQDSVSRSVPENKVQAEPVPAKTEKLTELPSQHQPLTTAPKTTVKETPEPAQPKVTEKKPVQPPFRKDAEVNIKSVIPEPEETYSVFEILPAPVTDPKVTILINPDTPEGLVYRIQVAVFRNPIALSFFKGITPIYGFRSTGITAYYAGMFRRSADAARARAAVRAKGFKDAFVVGMVGNKTVSNERAAVLEKEWGKKPLFEMPVSGKESVDTLPPTLVFRVEVTRSVQPLSSEAVDAMARVAGNRGMDVLHLGDGNIVYLIGSFITFESAEDYAGLLKRNGFRDSRVVAWLGKREIDVDTAKQLFDNLR